MKKLVLFSALFVFFVIIAVGIYAVVHLASLGEDSAATDNGTSNHSAICAVEQYAAEKYPDYMTSYDENSKTLTLKKSTDFSIDSAPTVYTNPSSYLSQAQFIALDISYACEEPDLTVVLCYLSKDSEPMLSVASNGKITKHWN